MVTFFPIIAPDRVLVVRTHPVASAPTTLGRMEGGAPFEATLTSSTQLHSLDSY